MLNIDARLHILEKSQVNFKFLFLRKKNSRNMNQTDFQTGIFASACPGNFPH
jgi:hypothetical protein